MSEKNFMSYGDAETVFSEYANAIKTKSGTLYADAPIGAIIPYGGSTAPGGWLLCQGQAVSRTTYAALFSAIGTAFGEGDGSSTFNLPDLRETIPVGTGTRASGVTAHDTYTVGQFKDDQMQNHDHYRYPNNRNGWSLYADSVGDQGYGMFASDSTSYDNGSYTGNVHTGRTGTTTHGKQLGVNYIIKAVQSALPLDITAGVEDMLDEVKAVIPSNASASNQVLVKSDLTSSVTSGSTAPITSGGVYDYVSTNTWVQGANVGSNTATFVLPNGLYLVSIDAHGYNTQLALYLVAAYSNNQLNIMRLASTYSIDPTFSRDSTAGTLTVTTSGATFLTVNYQRVGIYY